MTVPFSRPVVDLTDGDLVLRSMRDEDADYELVVRWRGDARIAQWYGGQRNAPNDLAEARVRYRPRVLGYDETFPCIGELNGRPVAYVQFYPVLNASNYALDDADATWGVDLFVKRGRNLVLTDVGRVVYRYADEIFLLGREMMETMAGPPAAPPGAEGARRCPRRDVRCEPGGRGGAR